MRRLIAAMWCLLLPSVALAARSTFQFGAVDVDAAADEDAAVGVMTAAEYERQVQVVTAKKTGVGPNVDRITCLRQDDLDLVKPLQPGHVLRMMVPLSDTTTKDDIYMSVDNIQIQKVSLTVKLRRKDRANFAFEIFGDEACCDGTTRDAAAVDFWINGTDLLIRNSWYSWAGDFAADRTLLATGQKGSLRMKVRGEGTGKWNAETGDWQIDLVTKEAVPFVLKVENQWILEKALNSFGGLDKVIMDNLWSTIEKVIPNSYAAALQELGPDQLDTPITAVVKGSQERVGAPLRLTVETTVSMDTVPSQLLQVLLQNFDAAAVAEKHMTALLEKQDIAELWANNKPTLAAVLKRYGITDPEFLKKDLDLEELRRRLLEAAKTGADSFVRALRPFMSAKARGEPDPFEGFVAAFQATGGWDSSKDEGRMSVKLRAPADGGSTNVVEMPKAFLSALGDGMGTYGDMLAAPPSGAVDAKLGHTGLTLRDGALVCKRFQVENMRLKTGPKPLEKQVWKLGGAMRDVSVKIPPSLNPGWAMTWALSDIRLANSGKVTVDYGEGVTLTEEPKKALRKVQEVPVPLIPRKGAADSLAGPVPAEWARPTEPQGTPSLVQRAPIVKAEGSIAIKGKDSRLTIVLKNNAQVSVNINTILRPILAARPVQDFGYVFFHARLERRTANAESGLPPSSQVVAVISCGHLRMINPTFVGDAKNPFKIIDFDPKNGQLQVDLSLYTGRPRVAPSGQVFCLQVYSAGQPARAASQGFWRGSTEPVEELCGAKATVNSLADAIEFQVRRFRSDQGKAREWNYGTHPRYDQEGNENPQYLLPPDLQTVGLSTLLGLR